MRVRGDSQSEAFAEVAMPVFDSLFNFACWLTHDRSEAEDLVQESYLKALKAFSTFQPGTNFRAWIFRILHNTFLSSKTGLAATRTVALDDEEQTPPAAVSTETPESILLRDASTEVVQEAIAALPVLWREVLLLCEVEEMSYREIAEALSIPVGTVMSRLWRARKALRQALERKSFEAKHA
jgi:RNA polymerase sigma-70 factor (ECF subfamily)